MLIYELREIPKREVKQWAPEVNLHKKCCKLKNI